jgi:hypothetical protein
MNVLEKDVVMGTFTHRETYLPQLCESIRTYLPHIPFIVQLDNQPINKNFNMLRDKFVDTKYRYWLFLDDDIRFVRSDTVKVALEALIRNHYALMGVYSTFNEKFSCDTGTLTEREMGWVPGYFQLVDSRVVGDVKADMNLPDGNTGIDTSYCVQVKQKGYKIGIAKSYVYHTRKNVWFNQAVVEPTNNHMQTTYGSQYFEWCSKIDNVIGD